MLSPSLDKETSRPATLERALQYTIEFRPSYLSTEDPSVEIESYVTSPDFADPDATPIVVFLGYGEGLEAAKEATRILSEMTGRAVISPYLNFENTKDPVELKESVFGMSLVVIEHINRALGRDIHTPVDVIGKSQGGAVAAELIVSLSEKEMYPDLIRNLALISPAGYTNQYLGDTPYERKKATLVGLAFKNNMRMDQWSPRSLRAGRSIVGLAARDIASGRFGPKNELAYGSVNPERVKALEKRAEDKRPTILLAGDRDPLFRLENYYKALGTLASEVIDVMPRASHSAIMAAGDAQLESAGYWLIEMDEGQRTQ
jgi:hypothetical protein